MQASDTCAVWIEVNGRSEEHTVVAGAAAMRATEPAAS